jgi:hypothetical protein
LDAEVEPEAAMVVDMPSMDVESRPLVPNVATRFRRTVKHGNGGVFYSLIHVLLRRFRATRFTWGQPSANAPSRFS